MSITIPLWINLEDKIYFTQSSGKLRPKYKTICSSCNKDRGYKFLQNAKTHPNCSSCAHKLDQPRVKEQLQQLRKTMPVWNKGLSNCFSEESKKKIGIKSANRNYTTYKKEEIKQKKKLTFAIKYGYSSIEKFELMTLLKRNLRSRLNKAVKGNYKNTSAVKDLGCSVEELKIHLESKFRLGMTWNNYGLWQIDHIVPLALVKNELELKKACHYSNLQPLWASDNLNKRLLDGSIN